MRFVIALYNGNSPYVVEALDKISMLRDRFSAARFFIVFDLSTAEQTISHFQRDYIDTIVVQTSQKNKRSMQLLRFLPVFDPKYLEEDVVIIDVHDDTEALIRACSKYLALLNLPRTEKRTEKDVVFAYTTSSDDTCIHDASVHKTRHTHRDAGFSVWKRCSETRSSIIEDRKFTAFLTLLQRTYHKYEYGADEVLMDVFLKQTIPRARQHLIVNPFPSQCCKSTRKVTSSFSPVIPDIAFHFRGQADMYICSRVG